MIELAVRLRSSATGSSVAPSAAVLAIAARSKAPTTWNRYTSTLLRWEAYAAREGTPFLPADAAHFANFLAEAAAGASGHTQTKQRSCAIDALSVLARVPSPVANDMVRDVRAGLRRTLVGTRGRARPIFSYELPAADALPPLVPGRGGGPRRLAPGDAVAPLSVRKRAREQAVRCSAVLEAAALRFDDIVESQIGDAVVLPDLIALTIFGSKTDTRLTGQPAVLPAPADPSSGAFALLESIRLGLSRLRALDPTTLVELATRFRAQLPARHIGQGESELCAFPADIRDLARPLYALGLPVHCLPLYGQWQHARLDGSSDLMAGVASHVFLALTANALTAVGVEATGLGAHSFRRGRAVELFHGNAPREVVTEVLRHRNPASTRPYITDAARMASLAVTMTAATNGRSPADRPRPPRQGAADRAAGPAPAPRCLADFRGPHATRLGWGQGLHDPQAPHHAQPLARTELGEPRHGDLARLPRRIGAERAHPPAGTRAHHGPSAPDGRPDRPPPLRGEPVRPAPPGVDPRVPQRHRA